MPSRYLSLGVFLGCSLVAATPTPTEACTALRMKTSAPSAGVVVAKNYDWSNEQGAVLTNKRGVAKRALLLSTRSAPAAWTSRYGSLTFNQYGRELPNGGMNERGLVVEVLWLGGSRYPAPDMRVTLNELQWVQYNLDNFATLQEVAAAAPGLRVSNLYAPVHYFVCDASGACGTFEYIGGALVVHRGKGLPMAALTNSTYARSTAFARRAAGLGGAQAAPTGAGSLARFTRAALAVRKAAAGSSGGAALVAEAFAALDDVAQDSQTKWQIVYEPQARRAHFRTHSSASTKTVDFGEASFDGRCSTPVMGLDMGTRRAGSANKRFTPWTGSQNSSLINDSFAKLDGASYLRPFLGMLASYPDSTRCSIAQKK